MAKPKNNESFWRELLAVGLYKRNQGRLTRQLSGVALALIVFFGAWRLYEGPLHDFPGLIGGGVPFSLALLGAWIIYRAVNFPQFADFLISVEAEMDKVSWSSRDELLRATVVVIVTMVVMGVVLFFFDMIWQRFFEFIGFLQISG